jgi:recombinational DNA repair protein RecT
MSLLGAIVQASQLGLEVGSGLGHAYLVPFKGECKLMTGYKGLIELARRSGRVASIESRCVYEKDFFVYEYGMVVECKHKPSMEADRGKLTHVYAIAHLKEEGTRPIIEIMSVAQVEKIRENAMSGNSDAWRKHFDEMARKTVIRRLCKVLPMSPELAEGQNLDDAVDVGVRQNLQHLIDPTVELPPDEPEPQKVAAESEAGSEEQNKDTEARRKATAWKEFNATVKTARERNLKVEQLLKVESLPQIFNKKSDQIEAYNDALLSYLESSNG